MRIFNRKSSGTFARATMLLGALLTFLSLSATAAPTDFGETRLIGPGRDPDVCIDSAGDLHVVYVRDFAVYYRKVPMPYQTSTIGREYIVGAGANPQVAVDSSNNPHVCFNQANYAWWNGNGFNRVQAFDGWRKNFIEVDSDDNVFVVGDVYSPRMVGVKVYRNGVEQMAYASDIGPDNPGGTALDANGVLHTVSRWQGIHYYSQFDYPAHRNLSYRPREAVQAQTSDFASLAVSPVDQSIHYVGTMGYAAGVFYKVRRNGVWGPTVGYTSRMLGHDQNDLAEDGDYVNPCIATDRDGTTYITYSYQEESGYVFMLDKNGRMILNSTFFGHNSGAKMTNPNVACRPDMSGAFVTWGTSSVYIRSFGDVGMSSALTKPCDFDGDGQHDQIVVRDDGARWQWHYRESSTGKMYTETFGLSSDVPMPGAFGTNAPGMDVPAIYRPETGEFVAYTSTTDGINHRGALVAPAEGDTPVVGDFSGNGIDDFAIYRPSENRLYYQLVGTSTPLTRTIKNIGDQSFVAFAFDAYNPGTSQSYDANTSADLVVYCPDTGEWHISCGNGTTHTYSFGNGSDDVACPGDYDGDGEIDFAVYRESDQKWRWAQSSTGAWITDAAIKWGIPGDEPVPGNYSSETVAWDFAVVRDGSVFHIRKSSDGTKLPGAPVVMNARARYFTSGPIASTTEIAAVSYDFMTGWWQSFGTNEAGVTSAKWGASGDLPVPGYWDNDSLLDYAVYRHGWWIINGTSTGRVDVKWGTVGDRPVPCDYDNDGTSDTGIYRDGWWIYNGSTVGRMDVKWGIANDIPYPGDYDGDNIVDLAVYRPSTGYWYIRSSKYARIDIKCGVPAGRRPGTSQGDIPTPMDYNGDGKIEPGVFIPSLARWTYVSIDDVLPSPSPVTPSTTPVPDFTYGTFAADFIPGAANLRSALCDLDRDGVLDIGIRKIVGGKTHWFVELSSTGELISNVDGAIELWARGNAIGVR